MPFQRGYIIGQSKVNQIHISAESRVTTKTERKEKKKNIMDGQSTKVDVTMDGV